MADSPQREGGRARARNLSPEQRREIAKKAAASRWNADLPKAAYEGELHLGSVSVDSAVLKDGRRVLLSRAFLEALGRPWKGSYQRTGMPSFLDAKNLKPFITPELYEVLEPVEYVNLRGQRAQGYRAELLPLVCDVYLSARAAGGTLTANQAPIAQAAEVLTRSLSKIGVIALVDEATGYQQARARDELQAILSHYIAEELLPWAKRFPDSYYEQLHRVWGWPYKPGDYQRNAYIGKLTNWLIYEQLPKGVLEELRSRNPKDPNTGRRKRTHHEHLTEDVGHQNLENQIRAVTTLLRATPSGQPAFFKQLFNTAYPGKQGELFPDYHAGEAPLKIKHSSVDDEEDRQGQLKLTQD